MRPYRPLEEISEIFGISLPTAQSILKKHGVDHFLNKWKIMIHAKDFYSAYTKNFNPSLFDVEKSKKPIPTAKKKSDKPDYSDIFQKLFGSAYETKKPSKISERKLREEKRF